MTCTCTARLIKIRLHHSGHNCHLSQEECIVAERLSLLAQVLLRRGLAVHLFLLARSHDVKIDRGRCVEQGGVGHQGAVGERKRVGGGTPRAG